MAIKLKPRLFTSAEYMQMINAGVFAKEERLELIDGEIVQMSPIGNPHSACVRRLTRVLGRLFGDRGTVSVQLPVHIGARYVPQPDVTLLRTRSDDYASAMPTPADCLLVIEVSDTTAEFDNKIKSPRYARGGVTELWIVELERDLVVVYREPAGDAYQHTQIFHRGESITVAALGEPAVAVDAILG